MNTDAKIEYEDAKHLSRTRLEVLETVYNILSDESLGEPLRLARTKEYLYYKLNP